MGCPVHKVTKPKSSLKVMQSEGEKLLYALASAILQVRDSKIYDMPNFLEKLIKNNKKESSDNLCKRMPSTYHLVI